MGMSELLIGRKNNNSFSNLLIGSHRLKDRDKDGVPDRFDCQPNNPKKDSTVQNIQKELGEWERAEDWVLKGKPTQAAGSGSFGHKVRWLVERGGMSLQQQKTISMNKAIAKYATEVGAEGLDPIFSNGQLTGFHDTIRQQSIGIDQITNIKDIQTLERYERAGIIELQQAEAIRGQLTKQQLAKEQLLKEVQAQQQSIKKSLPPPQVLSGSDYIQKPIPKTPIPDTVASLPMSMPQRIKSELKYQTRWFFDMPVTQEFTPGTVSRAVVKGILYDAPFVYAPKLAGEFAYRVTPSKDITMPEQVIQQTITRPIEPDIQIAGITPLKEIKKDAYLQRQPETKVTTKEVARVGASTATGLVAFSILPTRVLPVLLYPAIAGKEFTTEERMGMGLIGGIALGAELIKFAPKSTVRVQETKLKVRGEEAKLIYGKGAYKTGTTPTGKAYTETIKTIKGTEQIGSIGRKVDIYDYPWYKKVLRQKPKLIYEGVPYGTGKTGYKKATKELLKTGLTETQVKELLKYKAPKPASLQLTGFEKTFKISGKKPSIIIKGDVTKYPLDIRKGDIKTRMFQPTKTKLTQEVFGFGDDYTKSLLKLEKRYLTKDGYEFMKLSQAGKTTQTFEQVSTSKLLSPAELQYQGKGGISIMKEAELYKGYSLTRPLGGRIKYPSKAKIVITKEPPAFAGDISPDFTIKKLPKQYTRQVLKQDVIQVPLQVPTKISKPLTTSFAKTIVQETYVTSPSMVGGLGLGTSEWYGARVKAPRGAYDVGYTAPKGAQLGFESLRVSGSLGLGMKGAMMEREETKLTPLTGLKIATTPIESLGTITQEQLKDKTIQLTGLTQPTKTKQILKTIPTTTTIGMPFIPTPPRTPKTPIPPTRKIGAFWFPGEKKKRFEDQDGYDSHAYVYATKKRKAHWKKLNTKPLTKRSALSVSARYVDREISARGKVTKSKSKKDPVNTGEDYFGNNRQKFRTYKKAKGKKIGLPNSFIERRKYRADSRGEVSALKKGKREKRRTPFGF